jgi:hypothetical protein
MTSQESAMSSYIYLPVPSDEMMGFANDWNGYDGRDRGLDGRPIEATGRRKKGKLPYAVLFNDSDRWRTKGKSPKSGVGCLSVVGPGDKLYVLAHMDADSFKIGGHWDGKPRGFGPADLAKAIQREGLTPFFRDLRLYACGSGIPAATGPSFAKELLAELQELGYSSIRVRGYNGDLRTRYHDFGKLGYHKTATTFDDKNTATTHRAKDMRV